MRVENAELFCLPLWPNVLTYEFIYASEHTFHTAFTSCFITYIGDCPRNRRLSRRLEQKGRRQNGSSTNRRNSVKFSQQKLLGCFSREVNVVVKEHF